MENTFTQNDRVSALKRLPPQIQDLILSDEIRVRYDGIRKKHKLRIDETGAVAEETNALMVGLVKPSEFSERLHERLSSVDGQKIDTIVNDINHQILKPIRESLKNIQQGSIPQQKPASKGNLMPAYADQKEEEKDPRGIERTMPRDIEAAKRRQQSGIPQQQTPKTPSPSKIAAPPSPPPPPEPKTPMPKIVVPTTPPSPPRPAPPKPSSSVHEKPEPEKLNAADEKTHQIPSDQKKFFERKGGYSGNDPYREALE